MIKSLHVNPSSISFKTPQDQPVRLEVTDQDGRALVHADLKYSSTNTAVAVVDENGNVQPHDTGSAQINVTLNTDSKTQVNIPVAVAGHAQAATRSS